MAIQVTEKKKEVKLSKGVDIIFNFAIVLFIVVGAAYFFTVYLNAKAEETKNEIRQKIEAKQAEIPEKAELEKTAQRYFNLIEDFKTVAENQKITSSFYIPFQELIHPGITVYDFSLNLQQNMGEIRGGARDFVSVGQQFSALKRNENITSVTLVDLALTQEDNKRFVTFSFSLEFNEQLFKRKLND
jgi:hypothetical protein